MTDDEYRDRGTGRTTKQMKSAPLNAIYVWCNGNLYYPKKLANSIGRNDLSIVSPIDIDHRLRGRRNVNIVIDHATDLTSEQYDFISLVTTK